MSSRIAYHRPESPWRLDEPRRTAPAARHRGDTPSSTMVAGKVVLGALLVFMVLTFVALAPMSTTAVLLGLAGVGGLLAAIGRERYADRPDGRATARRRVGAGVGRGTITVASVALLVLALFVPDGYGVPLSVLGVTGLVALRLTVKPWRPPAKHVGSALHTPAEPISIGDDAAGTARMDASHDVSRRHRTPAEAERARYSASDRPTPPEWRRRRRLEYPMHAIG